MSDSPNKKRTRVAEDPEVEEQATKRQKLDSSDKKIKSGGSPAKVVEDESDYDPENEGSDSFDADFDAAKESDHGDVDNFDVEAYKKWREEHPDSSEPGDDDEEGFGEDEEDGESLLEDDSDGSDGK